jgi:hypothetical protein
VEAYHAAEAPPVNPALLATIDPQSLSQIVFTLHPSARVVPSSFPIVQIWSMNIDGGVPTATNISSEGESALVVRPHAEVEVRCLPAGAATFIQGLALNAPVAEAATAAFDETARFDLAGALRDLFMIHAIAAWNIQEGYGFSPMEKYA